jgi:hypothetical protein
LLRHTVFTMVSEGKRRIIRLVILNKNKINYSFLRITNLMIWSFWGESVCKNCVGQQRGKS